MENCKYYATCSEISKNIMMLTINDSKREDSLKSLHKRMDDATVVRKDNHEKLTALHDDLIQHMTWEEAELANSKKNDASKSTRLKIYMWLGGFIFVIIAGFTSYIFNTVSDNSSTLIEVQTINKYNQKQFKKIEHSFKDLNDFLRGK